MRRVVLALEVDHRLVEVEERRDHRGNVAAVDPEFVRVTARVMAVGLAAVGIGTIALYIAFRAFGASEERRDFGAFAVLVGAALLILLVCLILLRWSFAVR
jgi:hypothetical protein